MSNARLMKPLFYDGNFNRDGKKMRAVFEREISDGTVSYRLWRYLSCKVFPDITYMRYPKPAQNDIRVNQKRFYSHPRRIWLKTLWWYVHLSWQGSKEATYMVLKSFGTDTISDFIERPGKGYRLGLFRELIKAYSHVEKKSSNLFNIIATQNRVNCTTVEPALTSNGEAGYVSRLFSQLNISGGEKHAC